MITLLEDTQIAEFLPSLDQAQRLSVNQTITKLVQEYCNTTFSLMLREERYDSRSELVTEHRPIVSVLSMYDNGVRLIENTDFFVYPDKIFIDYPSYTRKGLRIIYSSGFPEIPQTVKEVAFELFRYKVFTATEGSLLFYKTQRIEERAYERDLDTDEASILSKLTGWFQPIARELRRGDGPLRIGVI